MGWRTSTALWAKLRPVSREMRHAPTEAEDALWQRLRSRSVAGMKFRRQHPIERFIVDFYCKDASLVIEIDGPIHAKQADADAARQEFIEAQDLRVLRFSNDEVLHNLDRVIAEITNACIARAPTRANAPSPPSPSSPSPLAESGLGSEVPRGTHRSPSPRSELPSSPASSGSPSPSVERGPGGEVFTAHMAVLSGDHAPNTRGAIAECFAAGVGRIEIDIHSLAGDDYIVTHARKLEDETTGRGSVGDVTPDDVRAARFLVAADDRPPLLSEIVDLARDAATELQLDLKDWRPMPGDRVGVLLRLLAPVRERVIVSTGQDWNLRRLHAAGPELPIGFDPGLYIEQGSLGEDPYPPRRLGAYGYRDEHPLAATRTESAAAYLEERMHELAARAPHAREWFVSYRLLDQMLGDGFDAVAWLAARGVETNVWTLDATDDDARAVLGRMRAAGVARITTNTTLAWQRVLSATA